MTFLMMRLCLRQSDENCRKYCKYVCLNVGYQYFEEIYESGHYHRQYRHSRIHSRAQLYSNEHYTNESYYYRVPCQYIGKQTNHKSERFGEHTYHLYNRYERYGHFEPPRYVRPEYLFPILSGAEDIDYDKGKHSQRKGDGYITLVIFAYTRFDDTIYYAHYKHLDGSYKSFRICLCSAFVSVPAGTEQ